MNILIVEDEPHAAARLKELAGKHIPGARVVEMLDSVSGVVKWFEVNTMPDLILMDIQLADGLSFEIFEKVTVSSPVIFTTAYDEYALKAFKVNSIDYLLKPIDEDEFSTAIRKHQSLTGVDATKLTLDRIGMAMQMLTKRYKERFVIKVGEHLRFVEIKDILYFFSEDKITFCRSVDNRNHIVDFTMDQLESLVDPKRFFRINRQYIVSTEAIADMLSHVNSRIRLVLKGGTDAEVIVARERVQEFKSWLDA